MRSGFALVLQGCTPDCPLGRLWQMDWHKIFFGVKVIFTRLIDYSNLVELNGSFIGNNLIELSQLERSRKALVLNADDELRFRTLHY
jgi:hypothetical protein